MNVATLPRFAAPDTRAIPLRIVPATGFDDWLARQDAPTRDWVQASGFTGAAGQVLRLPAPDLSVARVLFGWGGPADRARRRFLAATAATTLGRGTYALEGDLNANETEEAALGWLRRATASPATPGNRPRAHRSRRPRAWMPHGWRPSPRARC